METRKIYNDIAKRTGGDIYIGVVGPVRSGKSTFINKFMGAAIIPNIVDEYGKKRAVDELPQSADGKTVMTAEPKFIPDDAVEVMFSDGVSVKMRMIDCVGYLIPGALGMTENGEIRMVKTPWSDEPISFEEAAEQGTKKVITEHSTVAIVVTCDGTIADIPRESYREAEERIIAEMKEIGKPFVLVLNSKDPTSSDAEALAVSLEKKYKCPVALVNCLTLDSEDIENIFEMLLYEFPVTSISLNLPSWMSAVPDNHNLNSVLIKCMKDTAQGVKVISDVRGFCDSLEGLLNERLSDKSGNGNCEKCFVKPVSSDLSCGAVEISLDLPDYLYYKIICDISGLDVSSQKELISVLLDLSKTNRELSKYREAIGQLENGGYGIVMPSRDDLQLSEPEIIRSSGAYGVFLKAKAESIHIIKADIETEINPIVGTEEQAEEIIQRLIQEYENDPSKLWESNIFGKSLYELVNDGLSKKIEHLSSESREKLSETLSRIVNESSNGLICILV